MKALAIPLLLLLGHPQAPQWVRTLETQLRCGMTLPEVQSLTSWPIKPTSTQQHLGSYRVDGRSADLWLNFVDQHLLEVTMGQQVGWTHLRLSPKKNLCTGSFTFFINLEWVERLEGADVFLDGSLVQESASSGLTFEVSAGIHEVRLIKPGYLPIIKHLNLDLNDEGRQDILIVSREIRLAEPY